MDVRAIKDKSLPVRPIHLWLFITALLAYGISGGIFGTTFNNFLSDVFNMNAMARGQLEFPRELPGFLCAAISGALFFLTELRAAGVAALLISAGTFVLALTEQSYLRLLIALLLWSSGTHLLIPLTSAIGMQLAPPNRRATLLGQLRAVNAIAMVIGCGIVWIAIDRWRFSYATLFVISATAVLLVAFILFTMPPVATQTGPRPKFVYDRRYRLFYLLNILFGARKQLFLTFGPWVLVRIFRQPASTFARLWIIVAPISALINPQIGRLVDSWGERRVLMLDGAILTLVCLGYAFAAHIPKMGLLIAFVCYMLDQLLFVTGIARATYLRKIAAREEDVTASLSFGVSLDHIVSMSLPSLAGYVWMRYGYEYVFIVAAVLAICTLFAASRIREDSKSHRQC